MNYIVEKYNKFEKKEIQSGYRCKTFLLKKDNESDLYKILEISGDNWHGYMAVIYDPSKIELVFTDNYEDIFNNKYSIFY